jgi:hypothetical protein
LNGCTERRRYDTLYEVEELRRFRRFTLELFLLGKFGLLFSLFWFGVVYCQRVPVKEYVLWMWYMSRIASVEKKRGDA